MSALHPTPHTLATRPIPYTLKPIPYTLHPSPFALHSHPTPDALHPTSDTLHPKPQTLHPISHTLQPTLPTCSLPVRCSARNHPMQGSPFHLMSSQCVPCIGMISTHNMHAHSCTLLDGQAKIRAPFLMTCSPLGTQRPCPFPGLMRPCTNRISSFLRQA